MLLIFNIDEQLVAVLKNDGEACPYYDPIHSEKLSGENTFTFSVPADHVDSQHVTEGNLVAFRDLDQNWQLFEIKRVSDLHGDGLTRAAFCEHAFYELIDDFIQDLRPTDVSAHFALTQALTGTRWEPGTVHDLGLNSTNYYYHSALSSVQKVASVWKGELQFRIVVQGGVISKRYVDLLARRGADTGKQFAYGRHTQNIEREVDLTTVATALYGRGKGEAVETGGYGRRTTFASVEWSTAAGDPVDKPAGQEWVGDPDALAQWGRPGGRHRFNTFEDAEETDQAVLLQKTWDALQECKNPRVTYRLDVADLERLSGYEHEKVRLGDTVRCIDRKFNPPLLVEARVIEIDRHLLRPEETKVTLGNFQPTLADDALKQQEIAQTVRDRQGVWDKATNFQPGGIPTSWLDGIIDVLTNQLLSTTSNWHTDANGNLVFETLDGTAAMMLTGNGFMLADEKDTNGAWIWRTFGTGAGFTADELNAGQIRTSLVQILGNSNFYWDGDYLYIINPENQNEQIRLSKEGIRFTQDGGQNWRLAIGFDGIRMVGKSEDGSTEYAYDGVRVYDKSGNLMMHAGNFEALGDPAAFTRDSVAYLSDGTQVASGVPRYEYAALPVPVWQDTFDTDRLDQYTSGGDTPATWSVSDGVLAATGPVGQYSNSWLIKNDLSLQDFEINTSSDQLEHGGIVFCFQDNDNYYFLRAGDDGSSSGAAGINILKRVAGVNNELAGTVDVNWPRGTAKPIKVIKHNSQIEVWFDGAKIISATDTTFSRGSVGLRCHYGTNRYLDFTVHYAQQAVMVEEDTTNLLAANQASVETDLTGGFSSGGSIGAVTLTRDTAEKYHGSASAKLVSDYAGTQTVWIYIASQTPVTPGLQYTWSAYLRAQAAYGRQIQVAIRWLDGVGSMINDSYATHTVTPAWQRFSITATAPANAAKCDVFVYFLNCLQSEVLWYDFGQFEQKAYSTSCQLPGAARSAEFMTVPTSVFTKGNWTVKLRFAPTSITNNNWRWLWECVVDANNKYYIIIHLDGKLYAGVMSGGVDVNTYSVSCPVPQVGQTYDIMFSGNGSQFIFAVNGVQIASRVYTEPIGTLPVNMYVGSDSGGNYQANCILFDFAVLNKAETLADHQADFNSGLPLTFDADTTYLLSMDGHLQPIVRDFGLYTKNGRFILQDPRSGQGIEVWDGAVRKVLIGRLDDGTIGQEIVGGRLYSSAIYSTSFRSGAPGDLSYVSIGAGDTPIIIKENGQTALEVYAMDGGFIEFYKGGSRAAQAQVYDDIFGRNLRLDALIRGNNLVLSGVNIYADLDNTFRVYGSLVADSKSNEEVTSLGTRYLYVRESPEHKYVDEGVGQLTDGECRIDIDPIFLECIEPNAIDTPWIIGLTPYGSATLYIAEIGTDYFLVKEKLNPTDTPSNISFAWSVSVTRKGYANIRLPEVVI